MWHSKLDGYILKPASATGNHFLIQYKLWLQEEKSSHHYDFGEKFYSTSGQFAFGSSSGNVC